MNFLNLVDPGTKMALRNDNLTGKKRIARGSFSAVFENDEKSILKLTVDDVHYELLCLYSSGVKCLPIMISDFDSVGVQKKGDLDLYLFSVEKLNPVKRGTPESRLVRSICNEAGNVMRTKTPIFEKHANKIDMSRIVPETFFRLSENEKFPFEIREAMEVLGSFSCDYDGVGMDLHSGNFMIRPETGELVISDPVMSIPVANKIYATR